MAYAQRLIRRILEAERVRTESSTGGAAYRDEPILRTGADLARQQAQGGVSPARRNGARLTPAARVGAGKAARRAATQPDEAASERGRAVSSFDPDENWKHPQSSGKAFRRYAENDSAQLEFLRALKEDPGYNGGSTPAKRKAAREKMESKAERAEEKRRTGKKTRRKPAASAGPAPADCTAQPAAEEQPPAFSLDFSRLEGIRAAAAASCEALLVDEERFEPAQTAAAVETPVAAPVASTEQEGAGSAPGQPERDAAVAAGADAAASTPPPAAVDEGGTSQENPASPFTPTETAYLRWLLEGSPASRCAEALESAGIPESMMVDAINEKTLDLIGDIAIEMVDGRPAILEDYIEDMEGFTA